MRYRAAVITVSDKGALGERQDTSGPALCRLLEKEGYDIVYTALVPDEQEQIRAELLHCCDGLGAELVLTTGGTGFSPRDVAPETALSVIQRLTPGLPEVMRAESMKVTPHGCLSRSVAGIRGGSLILTLPGSERAAAENLTAVLAPLRHGLKMLTSQGSAECAARPPEREAAPSVDRWLREAKAGQGGGACGMYLVHRGTVRETARAQVRLGRESAPVEGMDFSFDREKVDAAVEHTRGMPGIFHVRVWLNRGRLGVGDDIMQVLVGGDIRPHVADALQWLVDALKNGCVREEERWRDDNDGS